MAYKSSNYWKYLKVNIGFIVYYKCNYTVTLEKLYCELKVDIIKVNIMKIVKLWKLVNYGSWRDMKMKKKKIISLMLVLALSISIIGCTSGDASLYDAIKNMQEVKAIESKTDISFNLSGQDLGEAESLQLNQIGSIVNGMKFTLNGKSIANEKNTIAKTESEVTVGFMGMNIPIKMWADMDLDNSHMKMIYEIPEMLLGMMVANPMAADMENPLMGKEYLVYDMGKIMNVHGEEIDYKAMIDFQKEFQPKAIKFMEDIQKDLKLNLNIIELQEEKEIDGEKIKVYRVNLNDESLREVVKDIVHYMLEDENAKEFLVDYMNEYVDLMKNMSLSNELSQEEMEEFEEELADLEENLDENLTDLKAEFDKFMEDHKDIKILGEEGINIRYFVNEKGYIIEEDGIMDFSIDLVQFANFEEIHSEEVDKDEIIYPGPEMKGKINLKIKYNTKNTNINSKDLEIIMPETTRENSLDMEELMEAQMEQLEEQMKIFEEIED